MSDALVVSEVSNLVIRDLSDSPASNIEKVSEQLQAAPHDVSNALYPKYRLLFSKSSNLVGRLLSMTPTTRSINCMKSIADDIFYKTYEECKLYFKYLNPLFRLCSIPDQLDHQGLQLHLFTGKLRSPSAEADSFLKVPTSLQSLELLTNDLFVSAPTLKHARSAIIDSINTATSGHDAKEHPKG